MRFLSPCTQKRTDAKPSFDAPVQTHFNINKTVTSITIKVTIHALVFVVLHFRKTSTVQFKLFFKHSFPKWLYRLPTHTTAHSAMVKAHIPQVKIKQTKRTSCSVCQSHHKPVTFTTTMSESLSSNGFSTLQV